MTPPVTSAQTQPMTTTQQAAYPQDDRVMSVGDWFWTMLVMALPLINIIMVIVWAASSTGNLNRRNYSRAALIWMGIGIAVYVIIFAMILSSGGINSAALD